MAKYTETFTIVWCLHIAIMMSGFEIVNLFI